MSVKEIILFFASVGPYTLVALWLLALGYPIYAEYFLAGGGFMAIGLAIPEAWSLLQKKRGKNQSCAPAKRDEKK